MSLTAAQIKKLTKHDFTVADLPTNCKVVLEISTKNGSDIWATVSTLKAGKLSSPTIELDTNDLVKYDRYKLAPSVKVIIKIFFNLGPKDVASMKLSIVSAKGKTIYSNSETYTIADTKPASDVEIRATHNSYKP